MAQAESDSVIAGDVLQFGKMMKKLLNNKEFSDIRFIIGPNKKQIYAHRCILAARCAVFKAMFADKPNTGDNNVPFVLSDMSPEIFTALLEFLYTNCVTLSPKTAIDVLATSLEYGIDDLRDLCVDYLQANISASNACDVMQAAVTYNQNDLKENALAFIEDNTVEVLKSKNFQEISEDTLVNILRSSKLTIDEIDLCKAVKDWAAASSTLNGKQLHEVARDAVRQIRLPLLKADELKVLEEENNNDHFLPVDSFSYAWKLHALKQGEKNNILSTCRRGTVSREHHKFLLKEN
ncbi:BTB/POZ domain-containing protein 19 [Biomphalaria glabrata]|nr:BTB/POZ domain-containing protein 19-like [Biomphalaria glabrata]KAI8786879.1 BTB/POZ domain-containing protein 19 [Biomphalaria glabrata]